MNSGEQKIGNVKGRRIYRIHRWVRTFLLAVVLPAFTLAVSGYHNIWETMFFFGGCALLAWVIYWPNWINSVIFTAVATIFAAIALYCNIRGGVVIALLLGFMVLSHWFWLWVRKRIRKDFGFGEDKK